MAKKLERVFDSEGIVKCFFDMAAKGVPPLLLTRISGSLTGKTPNKIRNLGLPPVLEIYKKGLGVNLLKIKEMVNNAIFDKNNGLVDMYFFILHVTEDSNETVRNMVTEALLKYFHSLGNNVAEKALLLECFGREI